jgi:hypothetical protein
MRHVPAFGNDPELRIRHFARKLQSDIERHDAVVVAPEDQRRQFDA